MNRSFIGIILALFVVPAMALGQNQGVVYYTDYQGTATFQVNGDGTGRGTTFPFHAVAPTTWADYPGGRQFVTYEKIGTVPGTTNERYFDIISWNAAGESKWLTAFDGPLYVVGFFRRSNDGQDSFFSFKVYDTATSTKSVYRALVSASEVADPLFQPLGPGDPRLELVASGFVGYDYRWDRTGTQVLYLDTRVEGRSLLRVKTAGVGDAPEDDPVLFDQAQTGIHPLHFVVSPTADQVVIHGKVYSNSPSGGYGGFLTLDAVTGAWRWLVSTEGIKNPSFAYVGQPRFSPDGNVVVFPGHRTVVTGTGKNKTSQRLYGLYKMPATGGPVSLLTETTPPTGTINDFLVPEGWCW